MARLSRQLRRAVPLLLFPGGRRAVYDWSASSLSLPPGFTFTRSGTAQGLYGSAFSAATYSSYATDTPRFERLSDERVGLRVEGARTNLLQRSAEFSNAYWITQRATLTADQATAPDGTTAADKLHEDGTSNSHRTVVNGVTVGSGATVAFSAFAKNIDRRYLALSIQNGSSENGFAACYDLQAGTVTGTDVGTTSGSVASTSIVALGNGWYRLVLVGASTGTTYYPVIALSNAASPTWSNLQEPTYAGDSASGVYIWGAQLEQASFASSYIPTTTASATRNAETLSRSVTTPSSGELTYLVDFRTGLGFTSGTYQCVAMLDGGATDYVQLANIPGTGCVLEVKTSNSTVAVLNMGALSASTRYRCAFRLAANSFAAVLNAGTVQTDASGAVPSGMNREALGYNVFAGNEQLFGHILGCNASPTVWRPPVSNAELQALSAVA